MVEILWHRRETRRKRRKQTSTCSIRRNQSTRLTHSLLLTKGRELDPDHYDWVFRERGEALAGEEEVYAKKLEADKIQSRLKKLGY